MGPGKVEILPNSRMSKLIVVILSLAIVYPILSSRLRKLSRKKVEKFQSNSVNARGSIVSHYRFLLFPKGFTQEFPHSPRITAAAFLCSYHTAGTCDSTCFILPCIVLHFLQDCLFYLDW